MFIGPGQRARTKGGAFPSGTQLMFINASAPRGWVRVATFDDALLRIVGSAAPSSGGANGFVAVVNAQTGTGTGTTGTGNTGTGTSGATTITTATMPAHAHQEQWNSGGCVLGLGGTPGNTTPSATNAPSTQNNGSGGSHTHTVPALTIPGLSVPSLSITFGIKYVDALIAKKS